MKMSGESQFWPLVVPFFFPDRAENSPPSVCTERNGGVWSPAPSPSEVSLTWRTCNTRLENHPRDSAHSVTWMLTYGAVGSQGMAGGMPISTVMLTYSAGRSTDRVLYEQEFRPSFLHVWGVCPSKRILQERKKSGGTAETLKSDWSKGVLIPYRFYGNSTVICTADAPHKLRLFMNCFYKMCWWRNI